MKPTAQGKFVTTRWSLILRAGRDDSPEARLALEELCRAYWYPLYAYLRRTGRSPEDAQDLTQSFLARFVEKGYLRAANPETGHFRTLLLTAIKRFAANEWAKHQAAKRGGGHTVICLDALEPEERYRLEPATLENPETLFDRRWAVTVLQRAMQSLEAEQIYDGHAMSFAELKRFLSAEPQDGDYAVLGCRLDLKAGSVASRVSRLRDRYGELVRAEIAHTVARPADVEEELHHLLTLIGR